jgi:hypothetical protein
MLTESRSRLRFVCRCGEPASILVRRSSGQETYELEGLTGLAKARLKGYPRTADILAVTQAQCLSCGQLLLADAMKGVGSA